VTPHWLNLQVAYLLRALQSRSSCLGVQGGVEPRRDDPVWGPDILRVRRALRGMYVYLTFWVTAGDVLLA
jgi:hypothetical protein